MYEAASRSPESSRRCASIFLPSTATCASTFWLVALRGMWKTAVASARRGEMSKCARSSAPSGVGPISNLSPSRRALPIACAIPGAEPDLGAPCCSVIVKGGSAPCPVGAGAVGADPRAILLLHIATATAAPRYPEQPDFGCIVETAIDDVAVEPHPTTTAARAASASGRNVMATLCSSASSHFSFLPRMRVRLGRHSRTLAQVRAADLAGNVRYKARLDHHVE